MLCRLIFEKYKHFCLSNYSECGVTTGSHFDILAVILSFKVSHSTETFCKRILDTCFFLKGCKKSILVVSLLDLGTFYLIIRHFLLHIISLNLNCVVQWYKLYHTKYKLYF